MINSSEANKKEEVTRASLCGVRQGPRRSSAVLVAVVNAGFAIWAIIDTIRYPFDVSSMVVGIVMLMLALGMAAVSVSVAVGLSRSWPRGTVMILRIATAGWAALMLLTCFNVYVAKCAV
jgi:hypothetical protein